MNIYILISLLSSLFSNYIFILPYHNINYNHAYIKKVIRIIRIIKFLVIKIIKQLNLNLTLIVNYFSIQNIKYGFMLPFVLNKLGLESGKILSLYFNLECQ